MEGNTEAQACILRDNLRVSPLFLLHFLPVQSALSLLAWRSDWKAHYRNPIHDVFSTQIAFTLHTCVR
jgi:hypothetical protein